MTVPINFLVEFVCPTLGAILANALFAAPISSLMLALSERSLGDLNPVPWAFMSGNCIGWVAYSYLKKDPFIFIANGPGILVSLWLNAGAMKLQFYSESHKNALTQSMFTYQEKILLAVISLWVVVLTSVGFSPISIQEKEKAVGLVVNFNLVIFFAAPLTSIVKVARLQDSSSIHRGTMILSIFNCTFWCIYGYALQDLMIFLPNGAGLILALLQAILIFLYPRTDVIDTYSRAAQDGDISTLTPNEDHVEIGLYVGRKKVR